MELVAKGRQLCRAGRHSEGVTLYKQALATTSRDSERAQVLCHLSGAYLAMEHSDDAVHVAREALELAKRAGDQGAEAHASLSFGMAFMNDFLERGPEAPEWEGFERAADLLERSMFLYEELGQIDSFVAIFTLAQAYAGIDELDTAERLYARLIHDLRDERWMTEETVASHAAYLRGRAFMGCARIEMRRGNFPAACDDLDSAAELVRGGDPWSTQRDLEDVARLRELATQQRSQ